MMLFRTKIEVGAVGACLLFLACTANGYPDPDSSKQLVLEETGGTSDNLQQGSSEGVRHRRSGGGGGGRGRGQRVDEEGGCEDGWLSTHHYCLLYTGLGEGEAEKFCAQRNALQVRGICVTKPLLPDQSIDNLESLSPPSSPSSSFSSSSTSSSSSSGHQCPSGWAQVQDYCYFNPGPASKVCELLGAQYMLNLCVARVPHEIPVDFMHAVKRLHGDDNHLERDTRLCCCLGGGLCK